MSSRPYTCALAALVLACIAGAPLAGCLTRPVVAGEPDTNTNFTTKVAQQAVNKIDLLFSIDNSASMGDKQAYLESAIPDLIKRLVTPNCVDVNDATKVYAASTADAQGNVTCPAGQQVEFPAVHDMHIGVVSSSLGPRLGDNCLTTGTVGGSTFNNNDDQGHLLTRASSTETTLADAASGFLAWFPPDVSANSGKTVTPGVTAISSATTLGTDFTDVISGVQEYGCGIESQLESWYRFLIQPDPYASLALDKNSHAQWVGVDTAILKQRHDFLRPDSLVAIIVLTDENDSEIDVRSFGGQGYLFMSQGWTPPHGTSVCATNPGDAKCTSCDFPGSAGDPSCAAGSAVYSSSTDWAYNLNLRHVHMKAKYGIDPQFPLSRYVTGLTSATVPDRAGEYPAGASSYVGNGDCQNPLFAASLPDGTGLSAGIATSESDADVSALCHLTPSTLRSKSLVFYAHIGGVPNQLLHYDPTSAKNSELGDDDWVKILGTDPDSYDYTGIDAHMIESYQPRVGANLNGVKVAALTPAPTYPASIPPPSTLSGAETPPQDPTLANNADPWNGREWITDVGAHVDLKVDREYACTFPLAKPRDCTDPTNSNACDCSTKPAAGLTHAQTSPLCDPNDVTNQTAAKAYPTIRELSLAHKLGAQGIVSSICPIDVVDTTMGGTDPYYGYRPAVATIVNRLKSALTNQCLPQKLTPDSSGAVSCLILATLPSVSAKNAGNPQADCDDPAAGFSQPDPAALAPFLATAEEQWKAGGGLDGGTPDPLTLPTCQVTQLTGIAVNQSCKGSNAPGWCYVTGTAAGACAQAIVFTNGTPPTGSTINLQCIEKSPAQTAAGASDGG